MSDWIAELKRLGELRDAGVLTSDEFQSEKTRILSTRHGLNSLYSESDDADPQEDATMAGPESNATLALGNISRPLVDSGSIDDVVNRIGSYKVLGLLGKGGMGEVYRARHLEESWARKIGGDVALKMMRPRFAKDPNFRERFLREAAVGKEVDHPNAARVHEVVLDGDTLGLVMDLVEGKSLQKQIPKDGMTLSDAIAILKPLAHALDHLHNKGIIHRDLKPENVRIRPNGDPVILDFGIAKSQDSATEMTKTGVLMGTVAYMAPEQIDAKHVGPEADRYAFGVIAYEMLAGNRPWEDGISEGRIYTLKLQGNLIPLQHVKPNLGPKISKTIMRMLSISPKHRHESCTRFIDVLAAGGESDFDEGLNLPNKDDITLIRSEYANLSHSIDDYELKIQTEKKKVQSIMKERDLAISSAERNYAESRRSAEVEIDEITASIQKAMEDINVEFETKRKEKRYNLDMLKERVKSSQFHLRQAKEEKASGWNSLVTMFSNQKKINLSSIVEEAQAKYDDANRRLNEAINCFEQEMTALEYKENEVAARFQRAGEAKLDLARSRCRKKINHAQQQLTEIKDKIINQYNKSRRKFDLNINRFQLEKEQLQDKLFAMRESYPDDVWIIRSVVSIDSVSFEMVELSQGKFQMGSDGSDDSNRDERPIHQVELTTPFWMSKTLVVQSLYEKIMGSNPSKSRGPQRPVENVSWNDAIRFCNKLSEKEGLTPSYTLESGKVTWVKNSDGYRLPTEAEWEYAAKSNKDLNYSGSNKLQEVAWYSGNSGYESHDVAKLRPNSFGLYDMSGNVWEWCWDFYNVYPSVSIMDPDGGDKGIRRVRRGGSWRNKPNRLRITNRAHSEPHVPSNACGFRIARYNSR